MGAPHRDERVDGRRLRWEQHKRERRDHIIAAAIAVIEEYPPGEEIHVHQIAERAGVARPAVYRHFVDRADLDIAVQTRVLELVTEALDPAVVLTGTIENAILQIVETYVTWADAHPSLHRVGLREGVGTPNSPLRQAITGISDIVTPIIRAGADAFDARLDQDDIDSLDLLVFGLVAEVVGAVRLWLARPERKPSAQALARRMADVVWLQLDGLARARGADIEPGQSIEQLVARALGAQTP